MRVIVTGDRNWYAPDLADNVVARLLVRYGPGLVIVHCGGRYIRTLIDPALIWWFGQSAGTDRTSPNSAGHDSSCAWYPLMPGRIINSIAIALQSD